MLDLIKNKFSKLDIHSLEVVKKSSSSLIVKLLGMAATFLISIILGRTVGPEGLGIINLANRVVAIVLIFSMLGMNNVILKEIAIAFERKNWQQVVNTMFTAYRINIPLALILSTVFILLTPWISYDFFKEPQLEIPLIIALVVVVPQVISRILASSIRGFRKIWQSNLINDTLSATFVAFGLVILLLLKIEITVINIAVLFAISKLIITLAVGIYWKKLFKFSGRGALRIKDMLKVGLPLLIVSSTSMIAANADTIMLGWLSNTQEIGFYSVASRLGMLTNFLLLIAISTLSPKIASLFAEKKIKELERMVQQVTKGLFFLGLFSLIAFIFAGEYILSLWGNGFIGSYWILIIITVGQFFNISTGSTGIILMMTGNERTIGKITFLSAVINLALNYFLIPKFGAMGAAVSTASTVTIENIIKVIVVKKKTGILSIPIKF